MIFYAVTRQKFIRIVALVLLFTIACTGEKGEKAKIRSTQVDDVIIRRFDVELFADYKGGFAQHLAALQDNFYPFLNSDVIDTSVVAQLHAFVTDEVVRELHTLTCDKFAGLTALEKKLTTIFRHIRYYFPDWKQPEVFTYVSGLYGDSPILYDGTSLIIALDWYLGDEYEGYRKAGLPLYRIRRMTPAYLHADIIKTILSQGIIPHKPENRLLDKLISAGKLYYLSGLILDDLQPEYIVGFHKDGLKWCKNNEKQMWTYFLEHQLLYATDVVLMNKFVADGPFTAAFQRESPARASLWVGWQIVAAYMKNNPELTPGQLIFVGPDEILKNSRYKPGR